MGLPNFLHHSPPPQKRKAAAVFRHLPVLLAVLVVAAGCGGGSGDSGGGGSTGAELEAFFADLSADTDVTSVQTAAAAAATPATHSTNGGLTQSSDPNNPVIHIEIGGGEGSRTYTITNAPESGTAAHTLSLGNDDITEEEGNIARFIQEEGGTGNTYLYLNADAVPDAGGAADYLAYGFWIHDPDNNLGDPPPAPTVGVFIDSSSTLAFEGSNVVGLTGEAQYTGSAEGLYYSTPQEGDPEFLSFIAGVALTADFSSAAEEGEISGTVNNFMTGNEEVDALFGPAEITLESADLTAGSTTFTGATSATVTIGENDVEFAGQWGGQFFGDTDLSVDDNPPGLAAGTFGLVDMLGIRTLLGVFHSTLQQP